MLLNATPKISLNIFLILCKMWTQNKNEQHNNFHTFLTQFFLPLKLTCQNDDIVDDDDNAYEEDEGNSFRR